MDTPRNTKKLNMRAFVALTIALCCVGLPLTGLFNHAYGLSLTVARHAWMSAHNALGILFVAFCIWHVLLNRRAFLKYLRGTISRMRGMSREFVLAGSLVGVTMLISVGHALH